MHLDLSKYELTADELRWRCVPEKLPFESTEDLRPVDEILGQERATTALRTGLRMTSPGFNVFVTGAPGTGRTTTVRLLLREIARDGEVPPDWCYVYNFRDPDRPVAISLPAGKGREFAAAMKALVRSLRRRVPQVFGGDAFRERRQAIVERYANEQRQLVSDFEQKAREAGFAVVQVQAGELARPDLAPLLDGKAVPWEQLEAAVQEGKLDSEKLNALRERYAALATELAHILEEIAKREKALADDIRKLIKQTVAHLVDRPLAEIQKKFPDPKVERFLAGVKARLIEDAEHLAGEAPDETDHKGFDDVVYRVNVVVDNSDLDGKPVIFENHPSYRNLFGAIERAVDRSGQWYTDFTKIKSGSYLRANGGFLVIQARDALLEAGVWPALKRAMKSGHVEIQSVDAGFPFPGTTLKPEPIPCKTKVVMIGDPQVYAMLYQMDQDFRKIFKVRADFDVEMPRSDDTVLQYATFVKKICEDENLLPFEKGAVARVIEYGAQLAGRKDGLSTRFNDVADLVREASYWAGERSEKPKAVSAADVDRALRERRERHRLPEQKLQEWVARGVILIDTEGEKVGQVNGLSVVDLGDFRFGRPSRITAQVGLGKAGVINIEREAELSGPIHNKGVLIIAGFLRGRFARKRPLVMSASLCFEQLYGGVEGDSASAAEIYALLSVLSGMPIRQDVAVTGSVNQLGQIQPVGGVNEKVEGFFDVCRLRGLTGQQGVIIPRQNVQDLMLREDVVAAVQEGKFHIYAIETVDEGIEILTGKPAGKLLEDGSYEPSSVNAAVDDALQRLAEAGRAFSGEDPGLPA
ncbi:MAG: AAA family ATPase [Calditrichaeota bacterium]|nr:AAA family ATPase [Calditrichota bacterium]